MLRVLEGLEHFPSGCLGQQSKRKEGEGVCSGYRAEIFWQFPPEYSFAGSYCRHYILSGARADVVEVAFMHA